MKVEQRYKYELSLKVKKKLISLDIKVSHCLLLKPAFVPYYLFCLGSWGQHQSASWSWRLRNFASVGINGSLASAK
jgi:hypothetical protein